MVSDRVSAYLSEVMELPLDEASCGIRGCESERRLCPEEGYGLPWALAVVRKGEGCWVSAIPGVLGSILPLLQREGCSLHSQEFVQGAYGALSSKVEITSHYHSFYYVPSGVPPKGLTDDVRQICPNDDVSKFGYVIPDESIAYGTAFGVFQGDGIVSYAEATPLKSVTERFGVMLVGIETVEAFRGRGYGRAVLATLTRRVLGMGKVPLYHCAVSNVASQRTAESCGYRRYGELLRFQSRA